ncbi:RHS repeat-associated core domain-containing protein [Streptomyces sp. NPDC060065]|uniref:RHS repeat protein n=1 Tax=Streptomyces sp. NPDC060065 TaxID=3347050 RepID=UPI0036BFF305
MKQVSSTSQTVTFTYDGDGNLTSRSDASGTSRWSFDKLNRESIRTLQSGAQTALAYTPGGEVDHYTDPNGKTDYTWDAAGRLDFLTDPAGKKTDFDYNNNDNRITTVYPGGTTQTFTLDNSGRPTAIKTASGTTTLVDLKYTYGYATGGTTDGTKIRTRTDNATKLTTAYSYDSQERLSYAKEADAAGVRKASWLYCFDKASNLTHQDGTATTCPATPTYTYNDASQLTAKSGSTTGWSYDNAGNETAAASGTARTGETWGDYSQLTSITTGTTTSDLVHAGTTNDERTKLGGTWFHVTDATGNVLGLVDEAGKRTHTYAYDPTGQARTTPTETTPQPYRYAGAYADQTGLYKMGARYYDPTLGRFTQPDPSGQETNP